MKRMKTIGCGEGVGYHLVDGEGRNCIAFALIPGYHMFVVENFGKCCPCKPDYFGKVIKVDDNPYHEFLNRLRLEFAGYPANLAYETSGRKCAMLNRVTTEKLYDDMGLMASEELNSYYSSTFLPNQFGDQDYSFDCDLHISKYINFAGYSGYCPGYKVSDGIYGDCFILYPTTGFALVFFKHPFRNKVTAPNYLWLAFKLDPKTILPHKKTKNCPVSVCTVTNKPSPAKCSKNLPEIQNSEKTVKELLDYYAGRYAQWHNNDYKLKDSGLLYFRPGCPKCGTCEYLKRLEDKLGDSEKCSSEH